MSISIVGLFGGAQPRIVMVALAIVFYAAFSFGALFGASTDPGELEAAEEELGTVSEDVASDTSGLRKKIAVPLAHTAEIIAIQGLNFGHDNRTLARINGHIANWVIIGLLGWAVLPYLKQGAKVIR
jgi:hypothetical protein